MSNKLRRRAPLLPLPPLLISESNQEFERIRDSLYQELKPSGVIEEMYVGEIVELNWQILRLRRCKAGVTNLAFHGSSARILWQLMQVGPDVARDWISNPEYEKQVTTGLAQYGLDNSIIIADAIQQSSRQLQLIEDILVSVEARRDKALARLVQYRCELGPLLRHAADRVIDGVVVALEPAANKKKTRQREGANGKIVELDGAAITKITKKDSAA